MKNRKIWIVVRSSRASAYGIGTYQVQITECLRRSGIDFGIIELGSIADEVTLERKEGYDQISVPTIRTDRVSNPDYQSRNTAYLLREIIPADPECQLIFHINLMSDFAFVSHLKKLFRCKILLTVHYTDWSFSLLGDRCKFEDIMTKSKKQLDESERSIRRGFEDNIKMVKICDCVTYIAQHSEDTFSKYVKNKGGAVVYNGLADSYKATSPQERDAIRAKFMISPETKLIVFAGRLDEVKGVKYLIKSFRELLSEHPDALLMIAGDGDFSSLLKEAEGIWSRIIFIGKIDKNRLYDLYRIADIGVVSSIHEEFGYVDVEMMMHGLPLIASATGGLAEIVEDGVSGLKVPIVTQDGKRGLDAKQLASKMSLLLTDNELATRIGTGGRKRFLERFQLSVFEQNITEIYNNL
jgi:glycosyltransferase